MKQPNAEVLALPDNLYPVGLRCIRLNLPNDVEWISAFFSHFRKLGRWYSWERDVDHRAKVVASRWAEIVVNTLETYTSEVGCGVQTIQYRMNSCGYLEFSIDGGETWEEVADFSDCFVWRNPDNALRNTIVHNRTFRPFTIRGTDGVTDVSVRSDGLISSKGIFISDDNALNEKCKIYASGGGRIDVAISGFGLWAWFVNAASLNGELYLQDTYKIHMNSGGSEGAINVNMWAVPGLVLNGNSSDFVRFYNQAKTTLLSSVDHLGRYVTALTDGEPTDTTTNGALAYDEASAILWAQSGDGWHALGATGPVGPVGPVGPSGITFVSPRVRPNPGEFDECDLALLADGYVVLPWEIRDGDVINVTGEAGWWSDTQFVPSEDTRPGVGYCPDGSQYLIDLCDYSTRVITGTDPAPYAAHMELVIGWRNIANTGNIYSTPLQDTVVIADSNQLYPYAFFIPNVPTLDGNSGGITFHVSITVPPGTNEWYNISYPDGTYTVFEAGYLSYIGVDCDTAMAPGAYEGLFGAFVRFWTDDTYTVLKPVTILDTGGFLTFNDAGSSFTRWCDIYGAQHDGIVPEGETVLWFRLFSTTAFSFYADW